MQKHRKKYVKLSLEEIHMIEEIYNYDFPNKFIDFLNSDFYMYDQGYDWKDFSNDNIQEIKRMISYPVEFLKENVAEIEWNEQWGVEPLTLRDRDRKIKGLLLSAPQLFPVYQHRYIPVINQKTPPVLSIHDSDVIYYGRNYKQYIKYEKRKNVFLNIDLNIKRYPYIPFWSDIM